MTARVGALAVALAVAVALPVTLLWPGGSSSTTATRAQLATFERHIDPLVSHAGQVVQDGMKPAVNDLGHDHVTPPAFIAHEADGWIADLSDVRRQVAALRVPSPLALARSSFVAALDLYLQAAKTFKAAALANASERKALIARGIEQATEADRVYDRGAAVVQSARRRVGLGPSAYFPDPAPAG